MVVSCYRVRATLHAVSPLHIGSGMRTGVIKHSHPYIPGSVLRGVVGTTLMRAVCRLDRPLVDHENCEYFKDCLYANLFGEEFGKASKVFFRYAYPLHLGCGGIYRPAPRTYYVCKNRQCQRLYDQLIPPERCEVEGCGKDVRPYTGYVCDRCGRRERYPIPLSRVTLTALDRERGSAAVVPGPKEAMGTLHTLELIERGSRFALDMLVHRDHKEDLTAVQAALVRGAPDEGVGGGKSRGLGQLQVEDVSVSEVTTKAVEDRAEEIDPRSFSVTLLSPMLLDDGLLAQTLLEGARRAFTWMFHEDKPRLPDVQPDGIRVSIETLSGWSLKEGRRRRVETAFSAGSVFQFRCDSPDHTLALALAALEWYPIGGYKPHGCGQVRVEKAR